VSQHDISVDDILCISPTLCVVSSDSIFLHLVLLLLLLLSHYHSLHSHGPPRG